jgi:hypothetical protein
VYSVEPLYEAHLSHPDPDLAFDQSLVGSWSRLDDDCLWTLTIAANQRAYKLTMAPAPECKSDEKTTRYEGHLLKLDGHRFLDVRPQSDGVCDLCLPLHSFFLVSQESDSFTLIPVDDTWLTQAIDSKRVALAHLQHQDRSHTEPPDPVVLTAPSNELKDFMRKYADDKAVFKTDSDHNFTFKRK